MTKGMSLEKAIDVRDQIRELDNDKLGSPMISQRGYDGDVAVYQLKVKSTTGLSYGGFDIPKEYVEIIADEGCSIHIDQEIDDRIFHIRKYD